MIDKQTKNFFVFLLINLILWSIVPLVRNSLPMDTQEAIIWGRDYLLGTPKHPPFSGYLAYPFYLLCGKSMFSMYLLSQICIALGVFYIWRLAKIFVGANKAVIAAMLQFGIIYYNFSSAEYNVNVVSIALWPICAFYFWQAYRYDKWKDWILFAVFAAANILNKYTGGVLLLALALFVVCDKDARQVIAKPKAYIAGIIAFCLLIPHLYWLMKTDFVSFDYIVRRSHGGKFSDSLWGHIIYPAKFIGAQILFTAAAWISYACYYVKSEKEKITHNKSQTNFVLCCGFVPLIVFLVIAVINGEPLKSMWGFPICFMLGIGLFYFAPIKLNTKLYNKFFCTMCGWSVLFALVYAIQCSVTTSEKFRLDNKKLVQKIEQLWQEETKGKPLKYIGASEWYADMVALYAKEKVLPVYWMDFAANPDLDVRKVYDSGAIIVAADEYEYNLFSERSGKNLSAPRKISIEFGNFFGKTKTKEIFYGFYNLKGLKNDR